MSVVPTPWEPKAGGLAKLKASREHKTGTDGTMAQWVEASATKPEDPRTHVVGHTSSPLISIHAPVPCICPTHIHDNTKADKANGTHRAKGSNKLDRHTAKP